MNLGRITARAAAGSFSRLELRLPVGVDYLAGSVSAVPVGPSAEDLLLSRHGHSGLPGGGAEVVVGCAAFSWPSVGLVTTLPPGAGPCAPSR